MVNILTQTSSLPPAAAGGKLEPASEPRKPGSAEAVDVRQAPGMTPSEESDAQPVSMDELQDAVSKINEHMQVVRRNLEFNVDDDTGRFVVKVMDAETEELVRQIPSEDVLKLAKHLEEINGMLFKAQA